MTAEPRVEELLATIRKAIDHDISELDKRGAVLNGVSRALNTVPQKPDADQDIAQLRSRVSRQRAGVPVVAAPPPSFTPIAPKMEPHNNGVSAILSGARPDIESPLPPAAILRPSYGSEEAPRRTVPPPLTRMEPPRFVPVPDPVAYEAPQRRAPPQHEQAYQRAPQDVTWVEEQPYQPPHEHYYAQQPQAGALLSPESAYAAQASFQALANSLVAQMGGDGRLQDMARDMLHPLLKEWLDDNLPQLVEKLVREEIERVARRGR